MSLVNLGYTVMGVNLGLINVLHLHPINVYIPRKFFCQYVENVTAI